jgi:hypothetical protein
VRGEAGWSMTALLPLLLGRVAGAVRRLAWLVLQNRSEGGAMLSDGGRHEWSRLTVSDASSGARIGATAYV